MRVQFLHDHNETGHPENYKGTTIMLDEGVALDLIARGIVKAAPLTEAQIDAIANEAKGGDEQRSPHDVARRKHEQAIVMRAINGPAAEEREPKSTPRGKGHT